MNEYSYDIKNTRYRKQKTNTTEMFIIKNVINTMWESNLDQKQEQDDRVQGTSGNKKVNTTKMG